jgi:hypothetical protein
MQTGIEVMALMMSEEGMLGEMRRKILVKCPNVVSWPEWKGSNPSNWHKSTTG